MTPDEEKTEANQGNQNTNNDTDNDTNKQENKKEISDAQLLVQSSEKMKKIEGSHQIFSEATKKATELISKVKSTTDSSSSNENSSDDE